MDNKDKPAFPDEEDDFLEGPYDFHPCENCDLLDACEDFGCAIKKGLRDDEPNY